MENIRNFEALAKLNLTDSEREWVNERADMLIESFDALEKVNTDGVEPLTMVLQIQNVLREDVSAKMITREKLLSNAPEQYGGFFQVPRTLE